MNEIQGNGSDVPAPIFFLVMHIDILNSDSWHFSWVSLGVNVIGKVKDPSGAIQGTQGDVDSF